MKGNILTISIGLLIGLAVGSSVTWYLTSDFINNAVVEAELKFNELLEAEKSTHQDQIGKITQIQENLEYNLISAEMVIDSLSTTINTRSRELNKIKRKYDKQISAINSMSHNELTEFFTKRYGN